MALQDLFVVTIVGKLHGQTTNYVLHYRETLTGAGDNSVLLAQAIDLTIAVLFRQWASDEWSYTYTQVQRFSPPPVAAYVINNGNAGPGAVAENSMPSECAAVITKVTQFAGRDRRGRVYVAGMPDTYELDSSLSAAGLTATTTLATSLTLLVTNLGGTWEWEPVVVSRKTGIIAVRWRSSRVNPAVRSQRRRQVGKGI